MTKRTAYDEKLERILRVAADIFARKGYHQASIRDIARATEVSLSGLYYYFDSKEELLFLIQDHAFGTLLRRLDRVLSTEEDPRRRLHLLIENHLRFFIGNMAEMKVLSHEADSLSGEFRRIVDTKKRRLTLAARSILEELNPDPAVDLRTATFALFGMMNWIYNWYREDRDMLPEELAEHMTQLFLGGFLQEGDLDNVPSGDSSAEGDTRIWSSEPG